MGASHDLLSWWAQVQKVFGAYIVLSWCLARLHPPELVFQLPSREGLAPLGLLFLTAVFERS